jgi:serine/threonine protein kinase
LKKFGEVIGRGGNGVVVKGINVETGDFAAIKQIDKELISEDKLPGLRVQNISSLSHLTFHISHLTSITVLILFLVLILFCDENNKYCGLLSEKRSY